MKLNKTTILWWFIALLSILNITTIATIFIHNHNENNEDMEYIITDIDAKPINGSFFKNEIGFNNSQMEIFRVNNRSFRPKANQIISEINQQKELMFSELQSTNPDTVKLNMISKQIGVLHSDLKISTIQFYISLNNICNTQQKEKLKMLFSPLFINNIQKRNDQCKEHRHRTRNGKKN